MPKKDAIERLISFEKGRSPHLRTPASIFSAKANAVAVEKLISKRLADILA